MFEKNNDTESQVKGTISINDGKWHHCVLTALIGTGYLLYVDGALDTLATATENDGNWLNVTGDAERDNITIGVLTRSSSSGYWNGAITEVSVWSDDLTLAQIQELYNDGKALDALTHSATANLVGYWRNNGLATWEDLAVGGSNDLAPTSVTETLLIPAGVDGSRDNQGFLMNRQKDTNALNLPDDGNSYVDLGSQQTIAADFTYELWVKPSKSLTNNYLSGVDSNNNILIATATEIDQMLGDSGETEYFSSLDADLALGTWTYIAIVRSSGTMTVYLDGDAQTDTETNTEGFDYRYFGWTGVSSNHFNGAMDEVRIYTKALSAPEVERNYNAGKRSHR